MKVGSQLIIDNSEACYNDVLMYCKRSLSVRNPEYAKKARMNFWLGNTPKTLNLYEHRGDELILPFGCLRELSTLENVFLESDFAEPVAVNYQCSMNLYDYQQTAVESMFSSHYGILQAPAGSGKTEMGIALVNRFGRRALWLCTTHDLLKQGKARAEKYMPSELIGTITEGKVNVGKGVTFATIQTMSKLDLARYKNLFDVIVVDECHRCAGSPTAVTQFSKVLNALAARHKIGLSATVHRSDGLIAATHALLGEIVHTVPEEAVGDRIVKVGIDPVPTGLEISRACLNTDGTLNYSKLISYLCESRERNAIILDAILQNGHRPCLVLSDRLGHLEALMNALPLTERRGAVMISGKMTSKKGKEDRERAIEDMRTGRRNILFATYSLAKEGLDIPCLERLFMTTPQKDYAVVTQSIGRVARAYEGKADPVAYDFVDNIAYLVRSYKKRCTIYRKNGCYFVEEGV